MSDVKIVRLTNGDQMICQISDHDDDNVLVTMGFIVHNDQQTQRIMYLPFAPWSTATGEVVLKKDSISFITDPASFLLDQYQDLLDGKLTQATPAE